MVLRLLVWLFGYCFGYMFCWFGYMVTGLVIWLRVRLYGYWISFIVTGLVI